MMKKVSYFKITLEGSTESIAPQELLEARVKQFELNFDLIEIDPTKTKVEILGETVYQNKIS